MTDLTVRDATASDIPAIKAVADLCFTDPWSEGAFASKLGQSVFYVATVGESVVGFAIISVSGDEAELYDIAVLAEYRGTRVSCELFEKVFAQTVESGAKTLYLEVRTSNERAVGFYRKHGFCEIGVRKNYYKNPTENAILMCRST